MLLLLLLVPLLLRPPLSLYTLQLQPFNSALGTRVDYAHWGLRYLVLTKTLNSSAVYIMHGHS